MEQQLDWLRIEEWVWRPLPFHLFLCCWWRYGGPTQQRWDEGSLPRCRKQLGAPFISSFFSIDCFIAAHSSPPLLNQFKEEKKKFTHYELWLAFLSSFSSLSGAVRLQPPITLQRKEKTKQAGLTHSFNKSIIDLLAGSLPHRPFKLHEFHSFCLRAEPPKQLNHQTNHSSHSQREEWMFDWLLLRRD